MSDKKIASIILNYNDWETTQKLVDKLCDYSNISKIVIIDNCSTDNSFQILDSKKHEKVVVLQSDKNGGYGYGNNLGINYVANNTDCEYLLICNPDVDITMECVDRLQSVLESIPKCVVAAPIQRFLTESGDIIPPWRLVNKRQAILSMSFVLSKLFHIKLAYDVKDICEKKIMECDVMQGALLMADTKFMDTIGRYDEEIFLYNEEECLAQKIKRAGKISILVCDDFYIHQHSVSISKSYSSLVSKRKLQLKSRLLYLKKYYDISSVEYFFIKAFSTCCLFEMFCYQKYCRITRRQ